MASGESAMTQPDELEAALKRCEDIAARLHYAAEARMPAGIRWEEVRMWQQNLRTALTAHCQRVGGEALEAAIECCKHDYLLDKGNDMTERERKGWNDAARYIPVEIAAAIRALAEKSV